ncbi:MAG: hypothetical protein EBU52_08140 [Cytophagia bacterium]|nr:hypothetical protein [Cytophagia bacterium]
MIKKALTILITVLITLLIQQVNAQGNRADYFPDSIRIEFPAHECLVVLEMKNYSANNQLVRDFPKLLANLMEQVKKSMPAGFSETGPYRIDVNITHEDEDVLAGALTYNFRPVGEKTAVKITQPAPETNVLIKGGAIAELKPPGWMVLMNTKEYQATLYGAHLEGLIKVSTEDFEKVIETLNKNPRALSPGRKFIRSRVVLKDGAVQSESVNFVQPLDMLSLNLHGGLGLVQERFFPELTITAGFQFNDRYNRPRQRLELGYQNQFLAQLNTEGNYNANINSFVSLSYGLNFSRGKDSPSWTGLGAAYLVRNSGNLYKGKTMKLYFFNEIGSSRLNVVPEFYLTNDFKKLTFGLTMRYTF